MTFEERCEAFRDQADNNVAEIVRDVLAEVSKTEGPKVAAFITNNLPLVQHIASAAAALGFVAGCEHGAMTVVGVRTPSNVN